MHRIFRTVNFKLVAVYAVIFSLSVFVLGLIVLVSIRTSVAQHIKTQIEIDAAQLMGDYRDDGIEELRHDIRERIENNPPNRLLYFLQSPDGQVNFDHIETLPDPGWHHLKTTEGQRILVHTIDLDDGFRFAAAADLESAIDVQVTVRNAFAVAFIFSLLLGIVGGLVVSSRFLARLDHFNRIAGEIGQRGGLSKRLPVVGSGDDFDQLAAIVNGLLDRIEKLVHEIQQVTTNVAHDLRTPLGRIRQKLEDLQHGNIEQIEYQEQLAETIELLDGTLETFSSLLRIAEIESSVFKERFTEVDLAEILRSLVHTYTPVTEDTGLLLESMLPENPVLISGDKSLLVQLFVNLIENSICHAGDGATQLCVRLLKGDDNIVASISDDGQGIPKSEYGNILKPFYRLEHERQKPGSGLGLNLVSAIATIHGATLCFADNNPGLIASVVFSTVYDNAKESCPV